MPIRILPPILANQIAAGEVVERPSSVVKELVENSLDAKADKIEIDIEKGGAKLIRIRDNGSGIAKDELVLALSRHATSKVATLDDLEGICSLGFRGEALASISSVARLTLTSRTGQQSEAWQAQAQGREMEVIVKPAAHPVGTSVEVEDLFFNTPARRKFMRSEKTEFAHIDELVRRIALSRFDVNLILRHNGKVVRQYKAASTVVEQERRLASVCGSAFMHHALAVRSEHSDVRLWGWLATPDGARNQNDLQYTYVNGRMMRDKLINHAIRQAYDELLPADRYGAYVLYIELDPHQVDVNVHPAKHEVRFHQARLIHDFIFQALFSALREAHLAVQAADEVPLAASQVALPTAEPIQYPGQAAPSQWYEAQHQYHAPTELREPGGANMGGSGASYREPPRRYDESRFSSGNAAAGRQGREELPDPAALEVMNQLLTTLPVSTTHRADGHGTVPGARPLTLIEQTYLLFEREGQLALLSLVRAERCLILHRLLAAWPQGLVGQPLLLPVSFKVSGPLSALAQEQSDLLKRMGLELKIGPRDTMIVSRVPALLRQTDLVRLLPELLQLIAGVSQGNQTQWPIVLCQWLVDNGVQDSKVYDFVNASRILSELLTDFSAKMADIRMVRPLSLQQELAAFSESPCCTQSS